MDKNDLMQEVRDNKSHFLVTLLDFCDQIKNQSRDAYYRSRLDMVLTDLADLKTKLVNGGDPKAFAGELEGISKELLFLKQSTQIEMSQKEDGQKVTMDYHKGLIEYIKKRVHCDVNNYDRRIRLILSLPFEKHRIEPLREQ